MKLKWHSCLIVAGALAFGCGEMGFDPQLSQAEESSAYASRKAPTPVSPQAKPKSTATENLPKVPEVPPTKAIKPAPAPVTPNSSESVGSPYTSEPVALPEIPKTLPPDVESEENKELQENKENKENKELQETKEDTLKLISDDPDKNLEVLNMALERWITEKGTLPERLEQLVMEEYLPMLPMEPIGKRFTIDTDKRVIIIVGQ